MSESGATSTTSSRSTLGSANSQFQLPKTAGLNQLFASVILEELTRLGVEDICLAPGSRSAPLALAVQTSRLRQHWHFDERGLAFHALGLAKASQRPVAIVTTSGSAVANLLPAIVEAWQTGVPLILLTADRPAELIDCAANQAILQQNIFNDYVAGKANWTPSLQQPITSYLTELDHLYQKAEQQQAPVHINLMLREPLYPTVEQPINSQQLEIPQRWLDSSQVFTTHLQAYPQADSSLFDGLCKDFGHRKGLIVAGDLSTAEAQAAYSLAQALGWPLLADVQSGLSGMPQVLGHSDLLLVNPDCRVLLDQADYLIQLGPRLVGKRLGQWIADKARAGQWRDSLMISRQPLRQDPQHIFSLRLSMSLETACEQLKKASLDHAIAADKNWLEQLQLKHQQVVVRLQNWLDQQRKHSPVDEMNLTRAFLEQAPQHLFLGNSLPVRLAELVGATACEQDENSQQKQVFTNRGASGIDGLLSSACGIAKALQQAETESKFAMLLGDLSLLHDLNSLDLLGNYHGNFVLVIINNDGGGIFHMLPIPSDSAESTVGRDCFQRPHGRDMRHAAHMFKIAYHSVTHIDQFTCAYRKALADNKPAVIEVFTQPGSAAQQIKQLIAHFSVLEQSVDE